MTGGLGQIGHALGRRAYSSVAVLAAGSLLAAVALSACGVDTAKASTVVQDARAAILQLADGSTKPASDGTTVPRGAVVSTGPGGSVSLVTAGRVVLLGSDTAVAVLDGRREQLVKGLVMVDGRRAGDLELDAGAATVTTSRGSVTRIERDALLRVASFRRDASVRAAGRRATVKVEALHQVQVPFGGLPGRVTALGLTRDAWERRYALDLVTHDVDLSNLAAGLDANPASTAAISAVVPATYRSSAPLLAGDPGSEQTLGFLIARATKDAAETYEKVRGWRAEGGSWGVVAALAEADVADVSAALDQILAPSEPVLVAQPDGGGIDVGGLFGGSDPTATGGGAGGAGGAQSGASPQPNSQPKPSRTPSPGPSPSSDPVQQVVTTVQSLLPTPPGSSPAPPPPSAPPVPRILPLPSPSPLLQVDIGGIKVGIG